MAIRIENKTSSYYEHRGACYRRLARVDESIKDYAQAIKLDDGSGNLYFNRAISYACLVPPDLAKALDDLDVAIKQSENKFKALSFRGIIQRKLGAMDKSAEDLRLAVQLDAANVAAHASLGVTLLEQNLLTQAFEEFTQALKLDAANHTNNRGVTNLRLNYFEPALEDFFEAITVKPNESRYFYNRAHVFVAMQRYEEALSDLDTAIQIDDKVPAYFHAKAVVFYQRGLRQECKDYLQMALDANGRYAASLYLLGSILFKDGKYEEASGVLSVIISLTPHDIAVADALGTLVDEAAQVRNVHDVTATVGQAGAYNDAHLLRGQCLHRLGKFDEAVDDYQRYLIKFPKDATGYNLRAISRRAMRQFDSAIADHTVAIQLEANNAEFVSNRALCYMDIKQYNLAHRDLSTALQLKGGHDSTIQYHRGCAQYMRELYKEAVTDLESAIGDNLSEHFRHDCCFRIGLAYANLGDHANAVKAYDQAVRAERQIPYVHERAKSLQMCMRHKEAIRDFDNVIAAYPRLASAYFRRAFSHKAVGAYDSAADDFEAARAIEPNNAAFMINYNQIYYTNTIELCKAGDEIYS